MKRTWKAARIIILVVAMCFSFLTCDDAGGDDNNGDGGGGDGFLGSTLTISNAQVYTQEWTDDHNVTYTPFTDTVPGLNYVMVPNLTTNKIDFLPLSSVFDGARTITLENGNLNISLGTPKASFMFNYFDAIAAYPTVTVNPRDAKGFVLLWILDGPNFNGKTISQGARLNNETRGIEYMYVDKNVTINVTATINEEGISQTVHYSMNLKAGWNSVIQSFNELITSPSTEVWVKIEKPSANDKWILSDPTAYGEDD